LICSICQSFSNVQKIIAFNTKSCFLAVQWLMKRFSACETILIGICWF
jgi:hypothetical protein